MTERGELLLPSITCLIGNGLSISYNPKLSVDSLTGALIRKFADLSGNHAAETLVRFVQELRDSGQQNFETLLGPVESFSKAIPYLYEMTSLTSYSREWMRTCSAQLAEFARDVYQMGLGIVLRYIAEQSKVSYDRGFSDTVLKVCHRLVDTARLNESGASKLTIATLNYDGLLTAAFTKLHENGSCRLTDLGHGGEHDTQGVAQDNRRKLDCHKLRSFDDLFGNTELLHLHGSLAWLGDRDTGEAWKFGIPELRQHQYWRSLRDGSARLVPKIVLTDQKTRKVSEWPFSLAYYIFENRLSKSELWFIGGYGFGDTPVNCLLRRAYIAAHRNGRPIRIFIVVPRSIVHKVKRIFPDDSSSVQVSFAHTRFPDVVDGRCFQQFFGLM